MQGNNTKILKQTALQQSYQTINIRVKVRSMIKYIEQLAYSAVTYLILTPLQFVVVGMH